MRKRLVRSIITLCVGIGAATFATAQTNRLFHMPEYVDPPGWSVGVNMGMSDLWGDVGTKSIVDHYNNDKYWDNPKFMGGLYARYMPHPAFGVRLGVNFGTLYASDNWNYSKAKKATSIEDESYQRYMRNLNVKNTVWEGQLLFEINLRRFNLEGNKFQKRFNPYITLGVGAFHFKSKGEYVNTVTGQTQWVDLYNLNLEGQGFANYADAPKKYSQWQMNVPLGLGLRWDVGRKLAIGVEYMYRYCFTDYLDNVSDKYIDPSLFDQNMNQRDAATARAMYDKSYLIDPNASHAAGQKRGNPAVKDGYSTFSINFYYKIKEKQSPWWY